MSGRADKVVRSLPPPSDGKLDLMGDTTHKPKRGQPHPLGLVTRQSESSPSTFGCNMGVLVARWDGLRIPIAMATIAPQRKGHQNSWCRQMLRDFVPPSWVREVMVLADAGYPAHPTLKLITDLGGPRSLPCRAPANFPMAKTSAISSTTCPRHSIVAVPPLNPMADGKISGSVGVTPSCISWAMSRLSCPKNGNTAGQDASKSS
jgi:hypothetical protein